MKNKIAFYARLALVGLLGWVFAIGAMSTSIATQPAPPCVPTEAHWENLVWHTWTGGPIEEAPATTSAGWNATSGDPHSANHSIPPRVPNQPYFVSHGGSGKGDWFLWTGTWTPATTCPTPSPDPSPSVSVTQHTNPPSPTPEPTTTVSPSPEPQVTVTPDPTQCPEGMVPGAPDDEGNFVCQNDNPTPGDEPVVELHDELDAPAPSPARATPTYTG